MNIRVMIVDDEPYIRHILRKVIEKAADFEVVSECSGMTEALLDFQSLKPSVVFMDIDLDGSSGIDCAKVMLAQNPDCRLIFATAYAEYMPSAFELYAFDYLVKPFDLARVTHTLDRIRRQVQNAGNRAGAGAGGTQEAERGSLPAAAVPESKLMLKGRESISFIPVREIIMVLRENSTTVIFTGSARYETSMNLNELEKKLRPPVFLRCHRSYIINVEKIRTAEPYGRWTYIVRFDGIKEDALMTRESFEKILEKLQIPQPQGRAVTTIEDGLKAANEVGYPVLVRPSFVLGGRAMEIVANDEMLRHYLKNAVEIDADKPVLTGALRV